MWLPRSASLALQDGPCILVAHSYGGAVIGENVSLIAYHCSALSSYSKVGHATASASRLVTILITANPIRTLLFELFVELPLRMMQRALDRNRDTATLLMPLRQELAKVDAPKDEAR
jgi:hypothetical protein